MNTRNNFFEKITRFGVSLFCVLSIIAFANTANAKTQSAKHIETTINAPTILLPNQGPSTEQTPLIAGVTQNNTYVDVYIDGAFSGSAKVKNSPNGTASWSYMPTDKLTPGIHTVSVLARNADGTKKSEKTPVHTIETVKSPPTPVLISAVVNNSTTYDKPFITGLSTNNLMVEVFINGKKDGEISPRQHPSGTANFAYKPSYNLEDGWYSIKARTKDSNGFLSDFTKELIVEIRNKKNRETNKVAKTKEQTSRPVVKTKVPAPTLISPETDSVEKSTSPNISGLVHNNLSVEIFINEKLNGTISPEKHPSGVTNFAYKPFLNLSPGYYEITSRSIDGNGVKSGFSNTIRLIVSPGYARQTVAKQATVPRVSQNKPGDKITTKPILKKNDGTEQKAGAEDGSNNDDVENIENDTKNKTTKPEPRKEKEIDEIMVKETTSTEPSINVDNQREKTEPEIIILGEQTTALNTTTPVTNTKKTKNTGLIVALVLIAIIAIGLISWFTSDSQEEPDDNASDNSKKNEETNLSEINDYEKTNEDNTKWEIEPVDSETEEQDKGEPEQEITQPPPPPPAPSQK